MNQFHLFLFIVILTLSCKHSQTQESLSDPDPNPHAEGFNVQASDSFAIQIADKVMEAMGGRSNWDNTRYITWNFFGRRTHLWDRYEGRDKVSIPSREIIIDMDIDEITGTVFKNDEEMVNPDSLKKYLEYGRKLWINDSYWLVMPFKLKDSGVTLRYLGNDTSMDGKTCYNLQLSFSEVGVTPENKYEVLVDTTNNLVCEWRYYPSFSMDTATIITPWTNYEKHGNIL
jgi:hypothetical protein